ncbi:MAG TPA: hypothetical protein VGN23_04590, partial [Verrucomicrobiae bacterium]
ESDAKASHSKHFMTAEAHETSRSAWSAAVHRRFHLYGWIQIFSRERTENLVTGKHRRAASLLLVPLLISVS